MSRISAADQLAMTKAPTIPTIGSIHGQPMIQASNKPAITAADTAASATTWTIAARRLLSRVGGAVDVRVVFEGDGRRMAVDCRVGGEFVRFGITSTG